MTKKLSKRLFTSREVLEMYPFKRTTLYYFMNKNNFPYYKIGRRNYFLLEEIDEWIKEHKVN